MYAKWRTNSEIKHNFLNCTQSAIETINFAAPILVNKCCSVVVRTQIKRYKYYKIIQQTKSSIKPLPYPFQFKT